MKLVSTQLIVNDLEISKKFYEHTLLQEIKYDFGDKIVYWGDIVLMNKTYFENSLRNKKAAQVNKEQLSILYLECDDIYKIHNHFCEHNVHFIHEIKKEPWQQNVLKIYDPDQNIIEIGEIVETTILRLNEKGKSIQDIVDMTYMSHEFVDSVIKQSSI